MVYIRMLMLLMLLMMRCLCSFDRALEKPPLVIRPRQQPSKVSAAANKASNLPFAKLSKCSSFVVSLHL